MFSFFIEDFEGMSNESKLPSCLASLYAVPCCSKKTEDTCVYVDVEIGILASACSFSKISIDQMFDLSMLWRYLRERTGDIERT